MEKLADLNNLVCLTGKVVSEFTFSHRVKSTSYYTLYLAVSRRSEFKDVLPLLISEDKIDVKKDYQGCAMMIKGQVRAYKVRDGEKRRIALNVLVNELNFIEECKDVEDPNVVYLDGYLIKWPRLRHTPLGRRVTDITLAVIRPYGKFDFIPCIAWGDNAAVAADLAKSDRLSILGRFQSREYNKVKEDRDNEKKKLTAYEISINKMECIPRPIDIPPVS